MRNVNEILKHRKAPTLKSGKTIDQNIQKLHQNFSYFKASILKRVMKKKKYT